MNLKYVSPRLTKTFPLENEDDADEKPTASKKAKTSDEMVWEWEGDGSNWTAYDENMNKEINTAFKSGKPKIALTNKTTKLEVIFARLVQRNTATGWERRVRIKPLATEGNYFVQINLLVSSIHSLLLQRKQFHRMADFNPGWV